MTLGKLMALAAMKQDLNVTWYPSYGAEVRGGTAHCHVVVKDGEIFCPLVEAASTLVIMNEPSLKRFQPRLVDGGLMVLNSSLAEKPSNSNGTVLCVPATDIANELKNIRIANMVMLGALNVAKQIVKESTLEEALKEFLKGKEKLFDINMRAYDRGREVVQ